MNMDIGNASMGNLYPKLYSSESRHWEGRKRGGFCIAVTSEHHSIVSVFLDMESWHGLDQEVAHMQISGNTSGIHHMGKEKGHLHNVMPNINSA